MRGLTWADNGKVRGQGSFPKLAEAHNLHTYTSLDLDGGPLSENFWNRLFKKGFHNAVNLHSLYKCTRPPFCTQSWSRLSISAVGNKDRRRPDSCQTLLDLWWDKFAGGAIHLTWLRISIHVYSLFSFQLWRFKIRSQYPGSVVPPEMFFFFWFPIFL